LIFLTLVFVAVVFAPSFAMAAAAKVRSGKPWGRPARRMASATSKA
jgi:hypothetical protein